MEALYLTMFITVIIAVLFLFLYFVNVKKGQYDDVYTPSVRMLFDDELVKETTEKKENVQKDTENKSDSEPVTNI